MVSLIVCLPDIAFNMILVIVSLCDIQFPCMFFLMTPSFLSNFTDNDNGTQNQVPVLGFFEAACYFRPGFIAISLQTSFTTKFRHVQQHSCESCLVTPLSQCHTQSFSCNLSTSVFYRVTSPRATYPEAQNTPNYGQLKHSQKPFF